VNGRSDSELPASVNCLINPGAVARRFAKLRAAKQVAQVTLEPPRGVWRQVEKYKARWARYWAERQ